MAYDDAPPIAAPKKKTVLFVDDERDLVDALRNALRKEPYRIVTANSGQEALEILAREEISIVVSDEQMPQMSGSELLSIVRERHPSTVRMILTGQASLGAAVRAINGGEVFRFLSKPCPPVELGQTIRQALQLQELTERSAMLLAETRRQRSVLEDLEKSHPGITQVDRDADGNVTVEVEGTDLDYDVESLLHLAQQLARFGEGVVPVVGAGEVGGFVLARLPEVHVGLEDVRLADLGPGIRRSQQCVLIRRRRVDEVAERLPLRGQRAEEGLLRPDLQLPADEQCLHADDALLGEPLLDTGERGAGLDLVAQRGITCQLGG